VGNQAALTVEPVLRVGPVTSIQKLFKALENPSAIPSEFT
jgi:hypothetical protein